MNKPTSDFARANQLVHDLLLVMFRPLVRILLRYSVPYSTVAETLKWVYVHESANRVTDEETAVRSAVAVETGLCRKEVKKYLDLCELPFDEHPRRHERLPSIVNGWLHDPRFSEEGFPKALSINGQDSFQTLVADYGADVPHSVVARELMHRGVTEQVGGQICLSVQHLNATNPVNPERAMRSVVSYVCDRWNGKPQRILVKGKGETIETMVSEWSTEIEVNSVVKEMVAAGSIEICGSQAVWLSELYIPANSTTLLEMVVHSVSELMSTIEHNLRCGRSPKGRLQQYVHIPGLSESDTAAFKSRVSDEWNALKKRLMAEFQPLEKPSIPKTPSPGVGIYYYVSEAGQNLTRKYQDACIQKRQESDSLSRTTLPKM